MALNTKDEILEAAVELFAARGYHETSMSRIADEAGISKGTLYWYFSGKEELFQELITTGFNILFTKVNKIIKKDIPADEMLYQYLETKIKFLEKHRRIAKIAVENQEIINPEFKEKVMNKHREMINYVAQIIDRGKKEEVFIGYESFDTAMLIIGMTNCMNSDFMFKDNRDRNKKVDFIYNIIKNGIARRE